MQQGYGTGGRPGFAFLALAGDGGLGLDKVCAYDAVTPEGQWYVVGRVAVEADGDSDAVVGAERVPCEGAVLLRGHPRWWGSVRRVWPLHQAQDAGSCTLLSPNRRVCVWAPTPMRVTRPMAFASPPSHHVRAVADLVHDVHGP